MEKKKKKKKKKKNCCCLIFLFCYMKKETILVEVEAGRQCQNISLNISSSPF